MPGTPRDSKKEGKDLGLNILEESLGVAALYFREFQSRIWSESSNWGHSTQSRQVPTRMSLELAGITAHFALKTHLQEILGRFGCLMNKSVFDSSFSLALLMLPEIKFNYVIVSLFLFQSYKMFIPLNTLMKLWPDMYCSCGFDGCFLFFQLCSVWMTPSHVLMRKSAFHIKMVQDIASKLVSFLINFITHFLSFRTLTRKEVWFFWRFSCRFLSA